MLFVASSIKQTWNPKLIASNMVSFTQKSNANPAINNVLIDFFLDKNEGLFV